jgi:hypothetical protein
MVQVVREKLNAAVNVPDGEMVQYTTALGAAILGHQRLKKLQDGGSSRIVVCGPTEAQV